MCIYVRAWYKSPDTALGAFQRRRRDCKFVYQWIEALAGPTIISSPKVQASVSESATFALICGEDILHLGSFGRQDATLKKNFNSLILLVWPLPHPIHPS